MNNARRKAITAIIKKLEELADEIEFLKDEEQEALDNLPESLQSSERGEAMESAVYNLDEAWESMQTIIETLEEAKE